MHFKHAVAFLDKHQVERKRLRRREQARDVVGTIALGFAPTPDATVPTLPFATTLVVKQTAGGSDLTFKMTDLSPK